MARPFFAFLSLSLLFSACTQRVVCPAFQSAFIYDQDELRKKFSYFLEDSTPKILTASKTKYLIAEPVSYRKKLRSLQTVKMRDVNPVLPDSMRVSEDGGLLGEDGEDGVIPGAELDMAARSVIDSTYIVDVPVDSVAAESDTVYMISKDKELRLLKYETRDSLIYDAASGRYIPETPRYRVQNVRYNVEQDNYMWYLRKSIVLPDVRLAGMMQSEEANEQARKEKKGVGKFFQNLFKKKKKDAQDTTELEPARADDDFNYVDESDTLQSARPSEKPAEEKKGGLKFLKKDKSKDEASDDNSAPAQKKERKKKPKKDKKKTTNTDVEKPKEQEEEEEEEDDGF
jgi:hypothetical protein